MGRVFLESYAYALLFYSFYLRKYGYPSRIASVFLILIGYIITSLVYITRIETAETVASLELSWGETNINVIMMAVGIYGLVCSLQWKGQNLLGRLVTDNAVKGYISCTCSRVVRIC